MEILHFKIEDNLGRLKVFFSNGSILYVYYNNYDEYAYQIVFSSSPLDRIRFDSMDAKWDVESKPNHFHPRFTKEAFESPMLGEPSTDMRKLCSLIQEGKVKSQDFRF